MPQKAGVSAAHKRPIRSAAVLLLALAALVAPGLKAETSVTYPVGTNPYGVAFDGANIWVTNSGSNTVTKLLASTGATVGTYPVGSGPSGIAFDGTNIWVASGGYTNGTVTKLLASTGAIVGTYTVGSGPSAIVFDGTNIWVTNAFGNNVTKLLASTGATVGTYPVGSGPYGVAFDGTNIWVTNLYGNSVTKLLASTGAAVSTYPAGPYPDGIAFDGANIWLTNSGSSNTVTELLASTGAAVGTYAVGLTPVGIAFDGTNIWVANSSGNTVTKLLASTGATVGTYSVGSDPQGVAFDGTNVWVTNSSSNTVTKINPAGQTTATLSVTSLVFGNQVVGLTSASQSVTVTNSGTAAINIASISITGTNSADYAETNTCGGSLTMGASCMIFVTFTPTAIGARTASISISDNASNSPQTISLAGQASFSQVISSVTYPVGLNPQGIVFDGTNIWVTNYGDSTVTKLLASSGVTVGTYTVGSYPSGIAFDGTNIWVVNNSNSGTVTKLRASTGAAVDTYTVGRDPLGIAFDGTNIWVVNNALTGVGANGNDGSTTKLLASTGATVGTYAVGSQPIAAVFDGANIWVTNYGDSTVTKLLASTGATVGTYPGGATPWGIAFDGANTWVASQGSNSVTKLLASTGATVGTYAVGSGHFGVAFDGANIWVTNGSSNTVTELLASTGATVGTYPVGSYPQGMAFDGANIWVTNSGSNTVTKISPGSPPATPAISSLSPASATAGTAALTLTVNGTGFVSSDSVTWSTTTQTSLVTAYVNPTTLSAQVPAGLLATAGTVQIAVSSPSGVQSNASTFTITPPAAGPSITSVSPSSAPAGSPSATVTIAGTGFASGSVALWNGLSLVTSYVNSTTLTAQIPAGDLVNQGTGEITVANAVGPASNSLPFVISSPSSLQFLTVAPCRVMDTRNPNGPLGGPFISAGTSRAIPIPSSACGVAANAAAYSLNLTVVPRTGILGYLSVWPTGQPQPLASTLNSLDGSVIANAAMVPAGTGGAINAFATNDTDLIVDINGYFVPPTANALQFYPLTPCRVLDTRNATGIFGGPSIAGGSSRSFPIPASPCGALANAAAYALNVTVVPQGPLAYLTAWPTGQAQPFVSTMNSYDGVVLANAAIVPAGSGGAVSFYATDTTDVVVDINGYFAPPASGGLNFYPVTPCRLADTRNPNGTFGGPTMGTGTTRAFPLSQGSCGLPASPSGQAYSLNITVIPQGVLSYLSTWPTGEAQPVVSTLNAYDGQVVANAAIVPAGSAGSTDVYVTNTTDVVIDTNGYFGPVSGTGTQSTSFTGYWTFIAQSSVYGFQSEAAGQLTQTGNSVSGQLSLSGTPCAVSASASGTVSNSSVSMSLNENGQLVTFSGNVSSDGNSASGTYAAPLGGCTNGDSGTWTGTRQ